MGIFDEKIAENLKVHKYEPPRHIVDFMSLVLLIMMV